MGDNFNESELVQVAMQIILHAGDARLKVAESIAYAKMFDLEKARALICEAKECIRQAHVSQTEVIQNETRGKVYDHSLLFTHAQDTLMTINSEVNLANQMLDLFEVLNDKLERRN